MAIAPTAKSSNINFKIMNTGEYFDTSNQREDYYVRVSPNQLPIKERDTIETNNSLSFVALVSLIAISITIWLWRSRFPKVSGDRSNHFENYTQSQFTKCRFFDNNSYLKCAVHPTKVLREEAKNCSDYWSGEDKFFHR